MSSQREKILRMVDEGLLSVDEALVLLEKAEAPQGSGGASYERSKSKRSFRDLPIDEFVKNYSSVKGKVMEFVESAVQKVKDRDFDFQFMPFEEVRHTFTFGDEVALRHVFFEIPNGNLNIYAANDEYVTIECEAKVYQREASADAYAQFLAATRATLEEGALHFEIEKKNMKVNVNVYLPKHHFEEVDVELFNGSVVVNDHRFSSGNFEVVNGGVRLERVAGDDVEIESVNGSVEVTSSHIERCEVETLNGRIQLDGAFDKIEAQSFNGTIECWLENEATKYVELRTTNGSIDVSVPKTLPVKAELKTSLGQFTIDAEQVNVTYEKRDMMSKLMRLTVNDTTEQATYIQVTSKAGNIQLKQQAQ